MTASDRHTLKLQIDAARRACVRRTQPHTDPPLNRRSWMPSASQRDVFQPDDVFRAFRDYEGEAA